MDKFDNNIKQSAEEYTPTAHFVDKTMQRVANTPKCHWYRRTIVWLPVASGALAAIVLVFVFVQQQPSTKNAANSDTNIANSATTANSGKSNKQSANSTQSAQAASGSDNASLQNDLNGINSSMNQENSDQNAANTAVNDNQQEVVVPTS